MSFQKHKCESSKLWQIPWEGLLLWLVCVFLKCNLRSQLFIIGNKKPVSSYNLLASTLFALFSAYIYLTFFRILYSDLELGSRSANFRAEWSQIPIPWETRSSLFACLTRIQTYFQKYKHSLLQSKGSDRTHCEVRGRQSHRSNCSKWEFGSFYVVRTPSGGSENYDYHNITDSGDIDHKYGHFFL